MSTPSGTPSRGEICKGIVLCPKCQPTERDVFDIKAMDGLRRTASGRDLACLCKSQLTPGASRPASASEATRLSRAASQTSVGTAGYERSVGIAADLGDVEMLGGDGAESGAAGGGTGSRAVSETRKRKKTSPALDMRCEQRSEAAQEMWKAVAGLRTWEENTRLNIEKKKRVDLVAFGELSQVIERACMRMEAREAYLMGRLAERTEMKDAVAEEVQRVMERFEANFEERHTTGIRQPTFAEIAKPRVAFPNLNVRARPRENVVVVYPPGGPKEGPRDASVETKSRLVQLIKPKEDNLQVRSMRMVGRGGVLVEAASGGDAGRLIENRALRESGFTVERPKTVFPKIMIFLRKRPRTASWLRIQVGDLKWTPSRGVSR